MYQGINNIKSRSVFSRRGLAAVIVAGVMASPLWLASQVTLASEGHHANQDAAASTSMDHKGMSMGDDGMAMNHEGMSMGSKEMHESMMKGMKEMQSMPMTGDTDQDFAAMMIEHHKGGIEMARIQMQHGKDQEARNMAEKTMATQQKEIKELEQWQQEHKSSMSPAMPKSP